MKCPFCNEELKETSIYMDGNSCFSHPYIGALEGGKDRCVLDGETLHYRAWQELTKTKQALKVATDALKRIDKTCSNLHTTNGKILNAGNRFYRAIIMIMCCFAILYIAFYEYFTITL